MAEALAVVHSCGLAHMDVKPENIYVSRPEGAFKLGDFGLAVPRNSSAMETGDSRCPCLPSQRFCPQPFSHPPLTCLWTLHSIQRVSTFRSVLPSVLVHPSLVTLCQYSRVVWKIMC